MFELDTCDSNFKMCFEHAYGSKTEGYLHYLKKHLKLGTHLTSVIKTNT